MAQQQTSVVATPDAGPEPVESESTLKAPSAEPALPESAAPEALVGSRENPVPVGQVLAFREGSAFKVGAESPTEDRGTYAVLPLVIQIDWASIKEQFPDEQSPAFTPWANFDIQFVSAAGRSYSTMDDYSVDTSSDLFEVGDVYEGTDIVTADVFVSVPSDQIAGGTWIIANISSGDKVFVATE